MAKVGRNAPCPCGSGKKYKKCCMAADEQRERDGQALAPAAEEPADEDLEEALDEGEEDEDLEEAPDEDDEDEDLEDEGFEDPADAALWERFEAADYEEQITIFRASLEEGDMAEDLAFEMLAAIRVAAKERGERERARDLLARLEQSMPDTYRENAPYFNGWKLEDALAEGKTELVPGLMEIFRREPDREIEEFFLVAYALMYYNQVQPLLETMHEAWPALEASDEVEEDAKYEFVDTLVRLTLLDHLDRGGAPRMDDPQLRQAVSRLPSTDEEELATLLAAMSGSATRRWTRGDLTGKRVRGKSGSEELDTDLLLFSFQWLGELRRKHGVPSGKGDLARTALVRYQWSQTEEGRLGLPLLLPNPKPFGRFVVELLDFAAESYLAAGLVELLPLYVRFLVDQDLVTEVEARAALRSLGKVRSATVTQLREEGDRALADAIDLAWHQEPTGRGE